MCPHGLPELKAKRGHMRWDTFVRIVDEAQHFAHEADLFGGGEALLHPRIFDMIRYTREAGIHSRLHTNATVLTEEKSRKLIESGLDYLSFSFDGYSKEEYERIRVNASYEQTLDNILTFLHIKQELNCSKPYTVIQVIETKPLDEKLRQKRRDLQAHFVDLPVDKFRFIHRHNYGGKVEGLPLQARAHFTPCTFPWYAIFILWDGTIVPCCVDWWGEYSLGNIAKTSLTEVWNSDRMINLRQKLTSKESYLEIAMCANCDRLWRQEQLGVPQRSSEVVKEFLRRNLIGYG
ncbi:radical SAM protein [Candidatus Bathyarchaeota archaeon A05DMB-2]|jgi:radical SAM protein with 4Fe4S-binding SPASM domain|nr:radical SAM protein [Candidatus Bathyarchaeota archaeon A05DMB-2]